MNFTGEKFNLLPKHEKNFIYQTLILLAPLRKSNGLQISSSEEDEINISVAEMFDKRTQSYKFCLKNNLLILQFILNYTSDLFF